MVGKDDGADKWNEKVVVAKMLTHILNKYGVKNIKTLLENNKCDICLTEATNKKRKPKEIRNAFCVIIKKNGYGLKVCKYHLASYYKQKKNRIYAIVNNFMVWKV